LEGRYEYRIIDGNVVSDPVQTALEALADGLPTVAGISVMPGPQVATAIQISSAIRAAYPAVPIVWGGYFPTLYSESAINADYVDYVVRGQGEDTLVDLLERLPDAGAPAPPVSTLHPDAVKEVRGLTWKDPGGIRHNPDRPFRSPDDLPPMP